jgi:hypothetical protein
MFRKRIRTQQKEIQKRWVHTRNECAWCSVGQSYMETYEKAPANCVKHRTNAFIYNMGKLRSATCHEVLSPCGP